jgi:hypothetical protein
MSDINDRSELEDYTYNKYIKSNDFNANRRFMITTDFIFSDPSNSTVEITDLSNDLIIQSKNDNIILVTDSSHDVILWGNVKIKESLEINTVVFKGDASFLKNVTISGELIVQTITATDVSLTNLDVSQNLIARGDIYFHDLSLNLSENILFVTIDTTTKQLYYGPVDSNTIIQSVIGALTGSLDYYLLTQVVTISDELIVLNGKSTLQTLEATDASLANLDISQNLNVTQDLVVSGRYITASLNTIDNSINLLDTYISDIVDNSINLLDTYITDVVDNSINLLDTYITNVVDNSINLLNTYVTDVVDNSINLLNTYVTDVVDNSINLLNTYVTDVVDNSINLLNTYVTDVVDNSINNLLTSNFDASFANVDMNGDLSVTQNTVLQGRLDAVDASFANVDMSGDLTVIGTLSVASDTDTTHILGKAKIGNIGFDDSGAGIKQRDQPYASYCIMQKADGDICSSAGIGKTHNFFTAHANNAAAIWLVGSTDGVTITPDLTVNGALICSNAGHIMGFNGSIDSDPNWILRLASASSGSLHCMGKITTAVALEFQASGFGGQLIGSKYPNTDSDEINLKSMGGKTILRAINYRTTSTFNQQIYLGNIGTANQLYFFGTQHITSDDRLKHNEVKIVNGLDIIRQLQPQKYQKTSQKKVADYVGSLEDNTWIWESGLIAQEVLKIPDLSYCVDFVEDTYTLNYNDIFTTGLAATKELDTIVTNQAATITNLQQENASVKSALNELLAAAGKPTI